MPATRIARSRIQREGSRRARDLRQRLSEDVRRAREDAGLSQRALARAAGVGSATLHSLERGTHDPSTEILARVSSALGMDLSIRLYPGTGPLVRDHLQLAMLGALMESLHDGWRPTPEVAVRRPVDGVIDLVLQRSEPPIVACEAQSELRRIEQQLRWSKAKADALSMARDTPATRLLVLRNTRRIRATVAEYSRLCSVAYPARAADAYGALTTGSAWPGDAIVWATIEGGRARLLASPPRGVVVGR